MNAARPQSSPLLNINDPIQVHLLVETALGDSKEYELLSPEEVDDLKKQCQSLTQRIEQTRQNLAIQSKYRDAAISMSKLYEKKKTTTEGLDNKKSRRNILGHRSGGSDQLRDTDMERLASERKCEELAAELWSLEKRLIEPQTRLLKHTAGILQMTHKGPKKTQKGSGVSQPQGMPGSPESIYTYSNGRASMEPIGEDLGLFDERSLYKTADRLDGFGDYGGRDSFGLPPRSNSNKQMKTIAKTEQKLEDFNTRLREVLIKANPQRESSYGVPPSAKTNRDGKATEPGETLQSHLDFMEKSIAAIDQEHTRSDRRQQESEKAMEESVEALNREVRALLLPYNADRPLPPELNGKSLRAQLEYFQQAIGAVEMELSRANSTATKRGEEEDTLEQMKTVLVGLWDIIQSGEEENRRRKLERRRTRTVSGLPPDEDDDMSADESGDPNEPYSIQAFSTKVQMLYAQATRLKDQKRVLQRQIKQQRELNNKSDASKEADMLQKVQELERIKALMTRTEMDADNVRGQLSSVMEKLDEARQKERLRDQARGNDESAAVRAAQEELNTTKATIFTLERELQELQNERSAANADIQGKLGESEAKIASLTTQIATVSSAQEAAQALANEKETELDAKEKELEDTNMEIARLQTEVTIARAELEGAYGSRAQRAAEVAANPAIQKEIDDLTKKNAAMAAEIASLQSSMLSAGPNGKDSDPKVSELKKELQETIEEYEQMTKASIEWEKERELLEGTIDNLRDERETLEAQLSDERVRWLGMKSPGPDGSAGPGSTSAMVLKNEFKKMMRDTRAEHVKALRVCSHLVLGAKSI